MTATAVVSVATGETTPRRLRRQGTSWATCWVVLVCGVGALIPLTSRGEALRGDGLRAFLSLPLPDLTVTVAKPSVLTVRGLDASAGALLLSITTTFRGGLLTRLTRSKMAQVSRLSRATRDLLREFCGAAGSSAARDPSLRALSLGGARDVCGAAGSSAVRGPSLREPLGNAVS